MGIERGEVTAVGDLVAGPAEVVESNTPLGQVIETLGNLGIGIVVVMDGGSVAGVISERDIVWALAQGADPDEIWAGDVMTRDLVTVEASTPIPAAAAAMRDQHVRHLLVLDGPSPGVVSLRDLIEFLVD
jgi:CBS domain-containing protein